MTIDNLVSADVVLPDGTQRVASERHDDSDLFWALRGGGGNFGVVTRFEFELHPVGPEIVGGLLVFPYDQAGAVLRQYRDFVAPAPEELNVWAILRKAPPLPFLPPAVHGQDVLVLAAFYSGEPRDADIYLARLRRFGTPHGEHIGLQPYAAWQQAFDPLLTACAIQTDTPSAARNDTHDRYSSKQESIG
jgi:FAD/FMN-containing dehydrogenase